jgi:hypothetical protein
MEQASRADELLEAPSQVEAAPQPSARSSESLDFLAELERLWEVEVEHVEMAVRFRP